MRTNDKKWRGLTAITLMMICLGIAVYCAGYIWSQTLEYEKGDALYEDLVSSAVQISTEDPGEIPGPSSVSEGNATEERAAEDVNTDGTDLVTANSDGAGLKEETDPKDGNDATEDGTKLDPVINVDFAALQQTNPEIIGWLYCPDTVINYPVAQGTDNSYYLTHLADGTYNKNGCLFMDYQNASDFSDDNTIIYGHHMQSGKMFASLVQYKNQEYFELHPVIYLITPEHQYEIRLFAGYTAEADSESYYLQLGDSHSLAEWMREVAAKSDFKTSMQLTTKDRIVTLSTCAYDFQNARYVVHGKLMEI